MNVLLAQGMPNERKELINMIVFLLFATISNDQLLKWILVFRFKLK